MATFISTTLAQRTGSSTTVFAPQGINGSIGFLRESSLNTFTGPYLQMQQTVTSKARKTRIRVGVPQLDADGVITSKPWGEIELFIPENTLQTDVNDLVGYLEALCDSTLTNANDILVNGVGVY